MKPARANLPFSAAAERNQAPILRCLLVHDRPCRQDDVPTAPSKEAFDTDPRASIPG